VTGNPNPKRPTNRFRIRREKDPEAGYHWVIVQQAFRGPGGKKDIEWRDRPKPKPRKPKPPKEPKDKPK
jgi:hypothetical protein